MNSALATYNTYADYSGDVPVDYNASVPTAQTAGFNGLISFGAARNYRVAVHELTHWLGSGTAGNWTAFNGDPYTTITNATTTALTDAGLVNNTRYYYVVSAVNISDEGANSAQVSATPSSTAPVNIAMSSASGALNFSWPSGHTGWRLQAQTNGLVGNWSDVAGAAQTNSMLLPADPNNSSVFYRLIFP